MRGVGWPGRPQGVLVSLKTPSRPSHGNVRLCSGLDANETKVVRLCSGLDANETKVVRLCSGLDANETNGVRLCSEPPCVLIRRVHKNQGGNLIYRSQP